MAELKGEGGGPTNGRTQRSRVAAEQAERKRYHKPALESYGRVVDRTRFGGSQAIDSGIGNLQT